MSKGVRNRVLRHVAQQLIPPPEKADKHRYLRGDRSGQWYRKGWRQMYRRLKKLYAGRAYDVNSKRGLNVFLADYIEVTKKIAKEEDVPLVDVYAAFERSGGGNTPSTEELLLDGLHPNGKGHKLIAKRLAPKILKLLKTETEKEEEEEPDDTSEE